MPRIKIGLQIEETSPLVRYLMGSRKGDSEWGGVDPDEIVKVTHTVESSDIQEINPGIYYNIPSITTAKQGDTLFSDDGRLFVYDEAGSRWFLWYTFDNDTAKIHTNNTLNGEGTLDDPLAVNATVVALKGDLNPLLEGTDNGDGTYTFTSVDGSTMFTIGSQGSSGVQSVNGNTGVVILDADDLDDTSTINKFVTAAEKADIASALQPGDNISDLNNDSGFVNAAGAASAAPVQSVNSQTGSVVLDADDIDDTSTTNKFVTQALINTLNSAVQPGDLATVATTGAYSDLTGAPAIPNSLDDLSGDSDDISEGTTNLFMTSLERSKLTGIASGAEVNVNADWNAVSGDAEILNKPTLGTASAADVGDFATSAQGAKADTAIQPSDIDTLAELNNIITDANLDDESNPRPPTAHTHTTSEITDFDTEVSNNVDVSQNTADRHTHTNKAALDNIVNTGAGNLFLSDDGTYKGVASGSAEWGTITGTLSSQTDLQNELDGKSDVGHQHTASDITDFDTAVGNNADVAANTNARHTHSNKALLDTYNQTNADITQAISDASTAVQPGDLSPVATTGNYSDLTGAPSIPNSLDDLSGDSDDITEGTAHLFMTTAERNKLSGIDSGAEVNVNADWNAVSGDAQILNKPTLGTAAAADTGDFATAVQGALADTAVQPGDNVSDLTNDSGFVDSAGAASAAPVQSVNSQTGSVILDADDIDDASTTNKFVTAAEKSDIASAIQPGDLATVATTGAYSDLSGTPTLGTAAAADIGDFATSSQGSLADSAVQSVTGVGVDNTDPKNPVLTISASGIQSVVGGVGIDVDNTDPDNPEVSLDTTAQTSLSKADSAVQPGDHQFYNYFKRCYLMTKDGNNLNSQSANRIIVSNVNTTNKTFETNLNKDILESVDFTPIAADKKWVGYLNTSVLPRFQIESYEDGVFTYSTAGVSNPQNPSNGAYVQFLNPFVNYTNIRSNDGPLFPALAPGASFDGVTIDYAPSTLCYKKSDGTSVLMLCPLYNNNAGRRTYLATSSDSENWTLNTPAVIDNSDSPYNGNLMPNGMVDSDSGDKVLFFLSNAGTHNRVTYAYVDEDINLLTTVQDLPIQGYSYPNDSFNLLDITQFDGKYRMILLILAEGGVTLSVQDRKTVEVVFDGSLTEVLDGTSTNTKTLIHDPNTGTGYTRGAIDSWRYVELNGQLSALVGVTDWPSEYAIQSNRQTSLMYYNKADDVWKFDEKGPFLMNPIHWNEINSRYQWQWDHTGGYPSFIQEGEKAYVFQAHNAGTDGYQTVGLKLNTPQYAPFLSGVSASNGLTVDVTNPLVPDVRLSEETINQLNNIPDTSDMVKNDADTYTSTPKATQIITLTQAEFDAIVTPVAGALYYII